ncbi:MAG: hypothetical protein J1E99_05115 [Muribaculaceae bacterium]|nr:hypothetical protein [Muribaculaceae bacterium]
MNLFRKYSSVILMGVALAGAVALTSCNDDKDEFSTEQYTGGIKLNVWGPSPVARGGELRFLGSGMNYVTGITLPGSGKITDLKLISNEEVRITVPQNAEPGYVTVHTSEGDITTLTELTFLEPISMESFSPLTVKPGEALTIKGEYLNNIHEVIFSEDKTNADVTVLEEDFLTHSRNEITLIVPAEAKTGAVILSDANEEMPNWIISDNNINIVLPQVNSIQEIASANPGDVITISGKDLDLVVAVMMANGEYIDFSYSGDSRASGVEGTITFVIPENACEGAIVLITASDIQIVAVNIGECQPENLVVNPATGVRGNDEIKISGINLQMVASVEVPSSSGNISVEPSSLTSNELVFTFPENGKGGEILLVLKGGSQVAVEIETAKPEILTTDELPAGAKVTLYGHNLDLLTSIAFQGGVTAVVESAEADNAVVEIPVQAVSGTATLNMANGESSTWDALIASPTGAYVVSGPGEEEELMAGSVMQLVIGNADMLESVLVNGESVQFIVNGENLWVSLPNTCGKGTKVTLQSTDGSSLTYTYDVTPATHVGKTIWSGMVDLAGWAEKIYVEKDQFEGAPAGAVMTFHISAYSGFQIQLNNCNWSSFATLAEWENWADMTEISIELTQDILDELLLSDDGWSNNALIAQGDGCIVTEITLEWENSLETTIWEGSWENAGWAGNQDLAWGGFDWSTVKAGSILRTYCTPLVGDGEWWCISFRHGDGWGNLPGDIGSQIDMPEGGVAEIVLTADIVDDLNSNGGLVITGQGYILTKVTIE